MITELVEVTLNLKHIFVFILLVNEKECFLISFQNELSGCLFIQPQQHHYQTPEDWGNG